MSSIPPSLLACSLDAVSVVERSASLNESSTRDGSDEADNSDVALRLPVEVGTSITMGTSQWRRLPVPGWNDGMGISDWRREAVCPVPGPSPASPPILITIGGAVPRGEVATSRSPRGDDAMGTSDWRPETVSAGRRRGKALGLAPKIDGPCEKNDPNSPTLPARSFARSVSSS